MAFTVGQLIENKKPVTVYDTDPVRKAQELMVDNKFSQLPVINKQNIALGMITSDSILRALSTFGATLDQMRVLDAMDGIKHLYRDVDDIFLLLDDWKDTNAVLIVDHAHTLIGLVTSYDITEYFRRRAEDMIYAEDIETTLKECISFFFTDKQGEIDEVAREKVIEEVMPSNKKLRGPYQKAVTRYLQLQGNKQPTIKSEWIEESFQYIYEKEAAKPFNKLNLNNYIDLFLHEGHWSSYHHIFNLPHKNVRRMLEGARDTRNALAHFRSNEITLLQREQLQFCRNWLERCASELFKAHANSSLTDETLYPSETLYPGHNHLPLAAFLQNQPSTENRLTLKFTKIEKIIGEKLPAQAFQHPSWWTREDFHESLSQQCIDVGWQISYVDTIAKLAIFTRLKRN